MRYFGLIDTDLVLKSSQLISEMAANEIIRRYSEVFPVPRSLGHVVEELASCSDSPMLRHWVSVSISLLRAKMKVLDPEPRFVAHFYVDSLRPERISEIHALRALEVVTADRWSRGVAFDWEDNSIQPPSRFSCWGLGTIVVRKPSPGMSVRGSRTELCIEIGGNTAKFTSGSDMPELSAGLDFEPSLRVETRAGEVILPIDVSGLADSYHSNAPIVRSIGANREWIGVFKDAIDLLYSQSPSMAADCVRLSPAALALHCGGTVFGSSSPQEVMGLVFLPGVTDCYDVAECFLHESLHQKLYRVEEGASLFEGEAADDEIYYSPWRSDPRPLRMLMHGAYVFAGVSNFWKQNCLNSSNQESRENAVFHCYYRAKQARTAMDIVSKYGCRTAMGLKVSEVIEAGIDDALSGLHVEPFVTDDAKSRLRGHREMFAKYRQ